MSNLEKLRSFLFGKECSYAYAVIAFLLALIPEACFRIDCAYTLMKKVYPSISDCLLTATIILSRMLLCVIVFVIVKCCYGVWKRKRRKVVISGTNYCIEIMYGDINECDGGKRVINFDECLTTVVGNNPADIKADSVCGQYLQRHPQINIEELVKKAQVTPARGKSKYNNQTRYEPGTIVPNGDDLLLIFAKLDENGRGCLTYDEYLKCLNKLWDELDIYHGTKDVYMPILGGRITRFDMNLSQQQLLDIMISSYRLSRNKIKIPNKLHIVCKERENFSINEVFGVD